MRCKRIIFEYVIRTDMKAAHLFVLTVVFSISCISVFAQKKNVRYVKKSEYTTAHELMNITVSTERQIPGEARSYRFEKRIKYALDTIRDFHLDASYELGHFEIRKYLGFDEPGPKNLTINHVYNDSIQKKQHTIKFKNDRSPESYYMTESYDGDSVLKYDLSSDILDYYESWVKRHMDSIDLLVVPPWPDTRNCELKSSEIWVRRESASADTAITEHTIQACENGTALKNISFERRIKTSGKLPNGMKTETHTTQTDSSFSYATVHYNDPPDSAWQYSYYVKSGDTVYQTEIQSVLRSDTLHYKIHTSGNNLLQSNINSNKGEVGPMEERYICMRKNSKLKAIDGFAIGRTAKGEWVKETFGKPESIGFYADIFKRANDQKTTDVRGMIYLQNELKPLIVLPYSEFKYPTEKQVQKQIKAYGKALDTKYKNMGKYTLLTETNKRNRSEKRVVKKKYIDRGYPRTEYEIFYADDVKAVIR